MKVVWLCQQEHILPWLNDLRHELGKLCDVVAYGNGDEFTHEYDTLEITSREDPDVIMIGSNQYKFTNLDKVKVPKALKCTDPWANIWNHIKFIKENDVDLVLMNYNCATPEYRKHLPDKQFGRLPHTVNPQLFHPTNLPKEYDIMLGGIGNTEYYPIRYLLYQEVPKLGYKMFPKDSHIPFGEYVRKINQTKILAFGNVVHQVGNSPVLTFPMAKIYEGMGCGVLVAMDVPTEAEEFTSWRTRTSSPLIGKRISGS